LWIEHTSGRLLRVEHPVPTSTDWTDWKLEAVGVEQMDGIRWEQFKLGLAQKIRSNAAGAVLASSMFATYQKQGIEELLASIPDWRSASLKSLENELNKVGYALLNAEQPADAVRLFRRIAEDFPDSANAWDSLAEGQIAAGDKAGARKSYQRVLQLLPDDEHARAQLQGL
jgi:tetratricopeptide (TPR) repeat protein